MTRNEPRLLGLAQLRRTLPLGQVNALAGLQLGSLSQTSDSSLLIWHSEMLWDLLFLAGAGVTSSRSEMAAET